MENLLDTEYVSLGGGGTAGTAYDALLRAFQYLDAPAYATWTRALTGVAGASAGAISALTLALDLDVAQRTRLLNSIDLSRVVSLHDVDRSLTHLGLSDTSAIRTLVGAILTEGGLSANATMSDLHRFTRRDVVIVASNLVTKNAETIRHATHPRVRVADALCASCAIPFLFRPVHIDGVPMVDAMLTSSLPNVFPPERTLFVQVDCNVARIETAVDYTMAVVFCGTYQNSRTVYENPCLKKVFLPVAEVLELRGTAASTLHTHIVTALHLLTNGRFDNALRHAIHAYLLNVLDPAFTSDEERPPAVDARPDAAP